LGIWITEGVTGFHDNTPVLAVFKELFDFYPELRNQEIEIGCHGLFDLDEEEKEECYDEGDSDENPTIECSIGLLGIEGCCFCGAVMSVVVGQIDVEAIDGGGDFNVVRNIFDLAADLVAGCVLYLFDLRLIKAIAIDIDQNL